MTSPRTRLSASLLVVVLLAGCETKDPDGANSTSGGPTRPPRSTEQLTAALLRVEDLPDEYGIAKRQDLKKKKTTPEHCATTTDELEILDAKPPVTAEARVNFDNKQEDRGVQLVLRVYPDPATARTALTEARTGLTGCSDMTITNPNKSELKESITLRAGDSDELFADITLNIEAFSMAAVLVVRQLGDTLAIFSSVAPETSFLLDAHALLDITAQRLKSANMAK